MSDPTTTPTTTTPTETQSAPRAYGPINQKMADELQLAEELAAVAQQAEFAGPLKDEEIDDAFYTRLAAAQTQAAQLITAAGGGRADKKIITQKEQALMDDLVAQLQAVQKRAKRKYTNPADPMREKYYLNQRIDGNRAQLESVTRSILKTVATDTLPGLKPEAVTSLQAALDNYVTVQSDQTGGEADAASAQAALEAKITEITGLRKQIQYAADTVWPAGIPANVPNRRAFKIPPNRSLK